MDIRTLVLGLGVFCATFLIGWWFNIGAIFYGTGAAPAQPVAAAATPATTGQGSSPTRSHIVVHVPQTGTAPPQRTQVKMPRVKYAQDPQAKSVQAKSAPRKSGFRIRIRRR
jgi:hypothetical protein